MDFGSLPPEITAALIHSGPGVGTWVDASAAWEQLAVDLEDSLPGYVTVLSALADGWRGPSSAAMTDAVAPYLSWLQITAQQCAQVAASTRAAAAAFEVTRGAVVVPPTVTANRTHLAQLLATNWLGTNLAAIAETEAQYVTMWVNNSAAMYRYAAATAQALDLPRFSSPPTIVAPTATATAAAAAAQAAAAPGAAAAPAASTPLGDLLTSILSTPLGFNPQTGWFGLANTYANQFIAGGFPINLLSYLAQLNAVQSIQSVGGEVGQGLSEGMSALSTVGSDLTGAVRGMGSAAPTAAMGVGVTVGKLTMPPATVGMLAGSKSAVQLAAAVTPLPTSEFGMPNIPMPPMMMPPRTSAGKKKREGRDYDDIEYGLEIKGTFMTRPPPAG